MKESGPQGGLLHVLEDRRHVVADRAHDEAVEERDGAAGAGAGDHPPGRQELEALQGLVEPASP